MRALFAATLIGIVFATAGGAEAGGGDSIAAAPELPIGQQQLNGKRGPDFWRVTLGAGDRIVANYGTTDDRLEIDLCLLSPAVTDFTLDRATCVKRRGTDSKTQLTHIANPGGRWTLLLQECTWTSHPMRCLDTPIAYELTAYVQRYTVTTLAGSTRVRAGTVVVLQGRVRGVSTGRVEIAVRATGKRWQATGNARIGRDSRFTTRLRLTSRGPTAIRARYRGDQSHRPSARTISVRVF
jgi:hypothetical protein